MSGPHEWPPAYREPRPDSYRVKPIGALAWLLGQGYEIEIGYDGGSALVTTMYAATERGAIRKARRFILDERRRIAEDREPDETTEERRRGEFPWHEGDCRAPRRPCVCPAYHAE